MKKYIWHNVNFPSFIYNKETIFQLLAETKLKEGLLLGKIEGLNLNIEQVRSSIGRHLGIKTAGDITIERNVEGIVEMMLDATQNYNTEMNEERLFSWQAAMFPTGYNGLYKIQTGSYRDDKNGPMQIVSGAIGHEKIHYEAPPAHMIKEKMAELINYINQENETDLIIKAAIVHLWFIIILTFEHTIS